MSGFKKFKADSLLLAVFLLAGTVFGEASVSVENPENPAPQRITRPQAVVLGIIEGLTEYLPVSSTGHLILAADAMHLGGFARDENGELVKGPLGPIMKSEPALNAFNIVIQFGAILAVISLYFKRIGEMVLGLIGRDEKGRKLLINLIVAFTPSAVVGLLLDNTIEKYLFSPLTVAIALAVGGVIMIVMTRHYHSEQKHIGDVHDTTIRSALIIGLVQCLALWPGTSRSMVTILAGLGVGLSMIASAEFSFLLALPTLTAATLYKTVSQWPALTASVGIDSLLIGIVISAVVAAFSVKFLIHHLTRHGLAPFGWYRIALASGLLYYFSNLI